MLNLSFIQPVMSVMVIVIFAIAIGVVVFNIIGGIKDSLKNVGKKPSFRPHSDFDNNIFNNHAHDEFMRQSQFMHDQAHRQHMADAQHFMDHSVQVNNDFMNNFNNHMF